MESFLNSEFAEAILPGLYMIVENLVWLLVGWASFKLSKFAGVKIEEKHARWFHQAVMTGVQKYVDSGLDHKATIAAIREHVAKSAPDAIGYLIPGETVFENIVQAKINEWLALKNGSTQQLSQFADLTAKDLEIRSTADPRRR